MIRTSRLLTRYQRRGFTLVELLIGAAISILIMTVLATAFQIGIDTMRQMRSAGDMADQLRAASEVIRRDLQGNIFLPEEGKPNFGTTLINQQFDLPPPNTAAPPIGGFMFISSGAVVGEGADPDGLASTNTSNSLHALQFTSILPPLNGEQGLFTATALSASTMQPQTFTSSAAELAYFLATPPGLPASFTNGAGTTQLFNLYRRQRLVAMNDDAALSLVTAAPQDTDVISVSPTSGAINTLRSLAVSPTPTTNNRLSFPFSPISTAGRIGEDILLSNVISFEVRVLWTTNTKGIPTPRGFGSSLLTAAPPTVIDNPVTFTTSSDFPFDTLAQLSAANPTFDSTNPPAIRVRAVQIRIRIFDPKLQTARQMTIVQNL
jgi:type II secretory pathway pseudopilin PulG